MRPTPGGAGRRIAVALPASLVALALTVSAAQLSPEVQEQAPVATVFRAFDGGEEVTATTRVRVMPAGGTTPVLEAELGAPVLLPPALYDVQALRTLEGGVVSIKRLERVSILHYPDEGGRHLEVINFQPGYGALQLRSADARMEEFQFTLFAAGDASAPVSEAIAGDDYLLFVVPAGRYDVRVDHAERGGNPDTHWLIAVDIPVDGTRLRLVSAGS